MTIMLILMFQQFWNFQVFVEDGNLIEDGQLETKCGDGRLGHQRNQSQTRSWTATLLARIFARSTFEICQTIFGLHAKGQTYQKGLLAGHPWLYATGLELDETWTYWSNYTCTMDEECWKIMKRRWNLEALCLHDTAGLHLMRHAN